MSKDTLASAPCMWMRGGTSKAAYFLAADLPNDITERDDFLLRIMGSPDPRQIDGMGGADPLTSKVAIIKPSTRSGVDVDYLFLQVSVEQARVSDQQNCGNILAGVAPFAIERGLVETNITETSVDIFLENTGQTVKATLATPLGAVSYQGTTELDGVPGTASPIGLTFADSAGATCGALLPTGNSIDLIDDIETTCIDGGMPTVILKATDMGISGTETRDELDANIVLKEKLESIRLKAGVLMNLGDVTDKTIPKMTMVSKALKGGTISTRTFIPHRCHASIGVLGAVSVATTCLTENTVVAELAFLGASQASASKILKIEHPIGQNSIHVELDKKGAVSRVSILRTARKLFDGVVFAAV